jgi:hypothetical protein
MMAQTNKTELELKLNPLQVDLIDRLIYSDDPFIAVRAGWGSGKTSALVFALWTWSSIHPNKSSLLVTDTAPRYRSVLGPELEKWLVPYGWVYHQQEGKWTAPNGHVVWCRSYFRPGTRDATHNPLEGLNITSGLALIDECQTLSEEVAQKTLGRLRSGPSPKMIMVGLPVWGAWWVDFAEKAGCTPIFYASHVNKANLSEAWFDAVKNLPESERLAMVENQPRPPQGVIYSEWTSSHVISNWDYHPSMSSRLVIDFGFRKPSVLILAHDPTLEADIICAEINPQEITLSELAKEVLKIACPRDLARRYPNRILLDGASGDKAGSARSDRTAQSAFHELSKHPDQGGIGMPFRWCTDPIRTDILNGIQRVKRLIHQRRILCTSEVWERGSSSVGNSFRKAILSYAWDGKETPKKDGREDPLDALRYDVINWLWRDSEIVADKPVPATSPTVKSKLNFVQSHIKAMRNH